MTGAGRTGRVRTGCDSGSATIWVLGACALVVFAGSAAVLRTEAVLARHRAEAAADLAALAAAGRIGFDPDVCGAARSVAVANRARVEDCTPRLAADGRSGQVLVRVSLPVELPVVGERTVTATARAARLAVAAPP